MEQQLKELKKQANNKTQSKVLEAELEIANNKLKEAEAAVNETPPMLLSLQAEIAGLRKHHRAAIHEVNFIHCERRYFFFLLVFLKGDSHCEDKKNR